MLERELLDYQRPWMKDHSRFKIGLWARQTGKDMIAAAEATLDCLTHPGTVWAIVAAGERQALESFRKAREWAEGYDVALEAVLENRLTQGALLTSAEM